ncbi:MAG: fructose-6-phosphate aldolase [Rickettsiaceae bacterium]|nr:fructose-6-phosphate aldolase [Rickettsiaceae bacterium]
MKIFLDSADVAEIKEAMSLGVVDGVTTNPSLMAKTGSDPKEVIKKICLIAACEISAEVFAEDAAKMILEGNIISELASNLVIKLPLTIDGLKACKYFSGIGIKTNVTLCFSAAQALLAANADASYVSPFVGRLDDVGQNGVDLIRDIKLIYSNYPNIRTKILAASIRSKEHVIDVARAGADAATMPLKIIKDLYSHDLTNKGLKIFQEAISNISDGF